MKVLQLINSLGAGGAEKLLVDAAITYSNLGIKVDILLLKNVKSPFITKLEKEPSINLFSLSENTSVYNPLNILKLKRYFNKYDVVHVHLFPCLYWAAIASLFNKRYRLVYTEHNTTNRRRKLLFFKVLDKFFYRRYDDVVTISDSVDTNLKNHLGPSFKNITKIYNGIDLNEIAQAHPFTKQEMGLLNTQIALIQVSSFTPQKNQNFLIHAMTKLTNNYRLFLIGDGPLKTASEIYAKEIGVDQRVHFLGIRSDVPRWLKSVEIVLLSSHFEGLSLSSVEGLASGKPFMASNVPGLIEVVQNAGILFDNDDLESLVISIENLINDEQYYQTIVRDSQKRAARYDILNMCKQYQMIYQKSQS